MLVTITIIQPICCIRLDSVVQGAVSQPPLGGNGVIRLIVSIHIDALIIFEIMRYPGMPGLCEERGSLHRKGLKRRGTLRRSYAHRNTGAFVAR